MAISAPATASFFRATTDCTRSWTLYIWTPRTLLVRTVLRCVRFINMNFECPALSFNLYSVRNCFAGTLITVRCGSSSFSGTSGYHRARHSSCNVLNFTGSVKKGDANGNRRSRQFRGNLAGYVFCDLLQRAIRYVGTGFSLCTRALHKGPPSIPIIPARVKLEALAACIAEPRFLRRSWFHGLDLH